MIQELKPTIYLEKSKPMYDPIWCPRFKKGFGTRHVTREGARRARTADGGKPLYVVKVNRK